SMQVRILGCSGGIAAGLRTTAILIDDDILIDAGTGVGDLTLGELRCVERLFLTHSHLDHTVGLPLFVDAVFETFRRRPLEIYAHPATIAALQSHLFNDVMWPDFSRIPSVEAAAIKYRPIESGAVVDCGGRVVRAVDVKHAVPTLGYCVEAGDKVLAFSGDTTTNRTLWPVLNAYPDVHVLVIEVSFPNRQHELAEQSGHYCPRTLASDLGKLSHSPDIWLTAMKPGEEEEIMDEVLAALPERRIRRLEAGSVLQL
ncbi:MAG: 3',5'-cyclic-nucleotide phosphodiesterase, partial [Chromatiales bacterium]|nr:3',5'-cyclic-nucleotide phosphodiesterase [Chromatiales bacterium]